MDRPLLTAGRLLLCGAACVLHATLAPTSADAAPACDWRSGPLFEVVTSGLYLYQTGPSDSIWEDSFPALLPDRDTNYLCLQYLFERGPQTIPGLEAEYAQNVAGSTRGVPPLQHTGVDVAPALVFLEPVKGRDYLISKITEARWSLRDVATIADSIWPRHSNVVRRVLKQRLGTRPESPHDLNRAVFQLVRFGTSKDFEFVRARLNWVEPSTARRMRLSLLSKNGEIDAVARTLGASEPAEYAAAADALLQWGHIALVCAHLKRESDEKRANGIAERYTAFRRGDYFESLPDTVITAVQHAPQAWECFPPTIEPSTFNAPRDTTKDPASRWHREPLGGREQ